MVNLSQAICTPSDQEWVVCRSRSLLYLGRFLSMLKGVCPRRIKAFHPVLACGGVGELCTPASARPMAQMDICIFGPVWAEFRVPHLIPSHAPHASRWYGVCWVRCRAIGARGFSPITNHNSKWNQLLPSR